jgi:hypothetical protein
MLPSPLASSSRKLRDITEPVRLSFIYDTYAGLPGCGMHRAVARVMAFQRRVVAPSAPRSGWFLKADVQQFYPSLRHTVLLDLLQRLARVCLRKTEPGRCNKEPSGRAGLCPLRRQLQLVSATVRRLSIETREGARMKRKDDFVMQEIASEWLLVPLGAQVMDMNGIVTLNDTGTCVWNLLAENRTADELAAAVSEQFEVDAAAARGDVQAFLDEIARLGMIEQ